jgi:hypothetical protein
LKPRARAAVSEETIVKESEVMTTSEKVVESEACAAVVECQDKRV